MGTWSPPLPARLAAARHLPLVGRRPELETFDRVWDEVTAGRRQVVLVGGEPGAGKTRLVAEVAGTLAEHGVSVLVGTCDLDAGVPYRPFAEMLDHLFSSAPAGSLAPAVDAGGPELRRLSAHVVRHGSGLDATAPPVGEVRRELFDSVVRLLGALAGARPVAMVLDDVHWAQMPTLALLAHVVQSCADLPLLVVATFRTNAPDRSDEVAARLADLHRLEGVRRLDLGGLDTEAIAEYLRLRAGLAPAEARAPAALLRDRTGGNPFFLRELWADIERRGGVTALRRSRGVPASIGDTLSARLAGLGRELRGVIEVAAVLGDPFDLTTLLATSDAGRDETLAQVDAALAVGLVEALDAERGRYSFVHELARQAVIDRMAPSRRSMLHARAADALERQAPQPALVPRLAQHALAAHAAGYQERALRYAREAGLLAERSLAFEDAAVWFERAASLPECEVPVAVELLLAAANNYIRACDFTRARVIYERLTTGTPPTVRLEAAIGYEDASWRPGMVGMRAADLLVGAIDECPYDEDDERYVRGLGSLARALALAGDTQRAGEVSERAIALARRSGSRGALLHALTTSLWHGTAPDVADRQHQRAAAAYRLARECRDFETLGAAVNFGATVAYLLGLPDELEKSIAESQRAAEATGQPYYRHVHECLSQAAAYLRGDFAEAEQWAEATLRDAETPADDMTDGPHGVQIFMIRRATGQLERFRPYLDGEEAFTGRWVPGLLALYTELGLEHGIRRALRHLTLRDLAAHTEEAQWPMELAFMAEGALAVGDVEAIRALRPFVARFEGRNLVSGTLIATFGSADRLLARFEAACGAPERAAGYFARALEMDRRMRSTVQVAETLAHHARVEAAAGSAATARRLADEARALATPIGQGRVLRLLEDLGPADAPDGLTGRELDVLRLLADGLSNQEIGTRLHISGNTAANHIRSILMKTGAANRTQAATYAAQRDLL